METATNSQYQKDYMMEALMKSLELEVQKVMEEAILPNIKKIIKKSAVNAVKTWSVNFHQKNLIENPYESTYQIQFVDNIIKTVMVDNPIKTEVQKSQ